MPLRAPDLGTFEHLLEEVQVDPKSMMRLSNYPGTELYWSQGAYRFDGPVGGAFGTNYAAPELSTAFAESVIHENALFRDGEFHVEAKKLAARHIVHYRLRRSSQPMLRLANFTGESLKRLGLNNDISSGDDYTMPWAWAQAVFDADSAWDGIQYVSRQNNDKVAYALFQRSGLRRGPTKPLQGRALDDLCDVFRVVAVASGP